jgi:hypothetical protein
VDRCLAWLPLLASVESKTVIARLSAFSGAARLSEIMQRGIFSYEFITHDSSTIKQSKFKKFQSPKVCALGAFFNYVSKKICKSVASGIWGIMIHYGKPDVPFRTRVTRAKIIHLPLVIGAAKCRECSSGILVQKT